jgi:hypothetical protein
MKRIKHHLLAVSIIISLFTLSAFAQTDKATENSKKKSDKLTADEVVAKHLASIGSAGALAAVKSIIAVGNSKRTTRPQTSFEATGAAQLASEDNRFLIAMVFNLNYYPYEKAGYDGEDLAIKLLPEGRRSPLGDFFKSHNVIFKEGLIGSVLSSAWALRNVELRKPRLSYSGTQKINDRQVHKLKYMPRKGSGLSINLFFDAETFRHVRTEYDFSLPPQIGTDSTQAGRIKDTRFELVEEFSNFKTVGNLTLPHSYKISYVINDQAGTRWLEWNLNLSQFVFNQPIGAEVFNTLSSN